MNKILVIYQSTPTDKSFGGCVNPINGDSEREINSVIEKGADIIMLPMFKEKQEVRRFLELVDGRVHVILLLEHIEAVKI